MQLAGTGLSRHVVGIVLTTMGAESKYKYIDQLVAVLRILASHQNELELGRVIKVAQRGTCCWQQRGPK